MSCPDIYINPTYWITPHPAEYGNLAIDVGAGGTNFIQGVARTVRVTVRNHGTDDSPNSRLQLYWADPSTGFTLMGQIDADKFGTAPGGDGIAIDGEWPENFAFNPDATVVGTNLGHVCLLARVQNTTSPGGACSVQSYVTPAATDARSAIRNIHVSAPAPSPRPSPPPGGGPGGMHFAFAASNNLAGVEDTRLEVRALDPAQDKERLATLFSDRALFHTLAKRHVKLSIPDGVRIAEGRERIVLPRPSVILRSGEHCHGYPRIGRLGPLSDRRAAKLLFPNTKLMDAKKPIDLKLIPGEMRQMIVHVVPCKGERPFYVIAVDHKTAEGYPIGGLNLVFIPPPTLF